jgi:lipoprotein-releasing system ATP-binding protein
MNDVTVGGQVPPLLEVRDVTRQFRMGSETLNVLRGVSFAIDEGEFVAIRGSSGSGKSTLLHVLGLLDRPNAGRVLYRGEDLTRVSESRRTKLRSTEFAFVFQFYYLLPELSAIENVLMPAMIAGRSAVLLPRGRREREERALDLLERVGLADRRKHRPHQLSGGERQRVALARALMNQPRLVFCDEPTGNLDSKTSEGIHRLMCELNETFGQAFLVVTHEPAMARAAKRELTMVDGLIVEDHEPRDREAPTGETV